jgi:hypothetical protein
LGVLGLWLLAFALGCGLLPLAFAFCIGLFGMGSFWKGKELQKGKESAPRILT